MKNIIFIFSALAAFASFGVTPNTEWQDVPGNNKVGEVLYGGGAQSKLVSGTNIKTVNGNSLLGSGNIVIHGRDVDGAARPLPKYLHALDFSDGYKAEAEEYYRSRGDGRVSGGCSAVRDGNFLYRNFDYPFDERAEFVVRMSAGAGRFASVGVAQVGTNLTEQIVTSGKPSRCYKWLPGATVDGVNENGVACEVNVVDGDPQTSGWLATGDIHPLAAVRWTLDNGTSAAMVASNLAARIRFPVGWTQNFHWMIADERETWIVENGHAAMYDGAGDRPVLTNYGVLCQLGDEWRYLPTRGKEEHPNGSGFERLDLLMSSANITNAWYTRAYRRETNPPWVSDLREVIAYTNEIFTAWATHDREHFRGQLNGGVPWWQTVHTSVYDVTNRVLRISVQETDDWYVFALQKSGPDEELVREIAAVAANTAIATNPATANLDARLAGKFDKTGGTISSGTNAEKKVDIVVKSRSATLMLGNADAEGSDHGDVYIKASSEGGVLEVNGTNVLDLAASATAAVNTKRDLADLAVYTNSFSRWTLKRDDGTVVSDYHLSWDFYGEGRWSPQPYGGDQKGDASSTTLRWEANEWSGGFAFNATRSTVPAKSADRLATTNGVAKVAVAKSVTPMAGELGRVYLSDADAGAYGVGWMCISFEGGPANFTWHIPTMDEYLSGANQTFASRWWAANEISAATNALDAATREYVAAATNAALRADNPAFSNAVLAVGMSISTNDVAAIHAMVETFGDFPVGTGATTLGGLLAALAAAVAWLKRKTAEIETSVGAANGDLEDALNGEVN